MKYKVSEGTLLVAPFVVIFFLPGVGVFIGLVLFLMWIADKVSDAQLKEAMKLNPPSKIIMPAPQRASAPVSALSEEERNEIIEAALAETQRQLAYVVCPNPIFRQRYFDTVFTRLCARQGLKVNKFFWKKIEE